MEARRRLWIRLLERTVYTPGYFRPLVETQRLEILKCLLATESVKQTGLVLGIGKRTIEYKLKRWRDQIESPDRPIEQCASCTRWSDEFSSRQGFSLHKSHCRKKKARTLENKRRRKQ